MDVGVISCAKKNATVGLALSERAFASSQTVPIVVSPTYIRFFVARGLFAATTIVNIMVDAIKTH